MCSCIVRSRSASLHVHLKALLGIVYYYFPYSNWKIFHKQLNQILEEKLLRIADRGLSDKQRLLQEISQLNVRLELRDQQLEQARLCNERLKRENERFKSDISVAVNLLHCQRPSTHSSCKLDNVSNTILLLLN